MTTEIYTLSYTTLFRSGGAGAYRFIGGTLLLTDNVIPNLQMLGGTVNLGVDRKGTRLNSSRSNTWHLAGGQIIRGTFNCGAGASGNLVVAEEALMNWSG